MKMILFCLALLFSSGFAFGQVADSANTLTYEDYMLKSKKQKTFGWILIVTGMVGVGITGMGETVHDLATILTTPSARQANRRSFIVPYALSTATMAGGAILLFISSKNKKKARAASLGLEMETAPVLQQQTVKNYTYPSLSLKIRL